MNICDRSELEVSPLWGMHTVIACKRWLLERYIANRSGGWFEEIRTITPLGCASHLAEGINPRK